MTEQIRKQWKLVPVWIRKPIVLIAGLFFFVAAALTGWIPGPGGIPLFLIGVAILATEFKWAKYLQDFVLNIVYAVGRWYRRHRQLGMIILTLLTLFGAFMLYLMIRMVFFS